MFNDHCWKAVNLKMKCNPFGRVKNRGISAVSQILRSGDVSDGITMIQLFEIISDLFLISYFYLSRAIRVKLILVHLGPPGSLMAASILPQRSPA
jgi:hypothetical protein